MTASRLLAGFFLLAFIAGAVSAQNGDPEPKPVAPKSFYKVDQKMCDKIKDDMTEAKVREILGGPSHAESRTVFAAPFSNKGMPVIRKQWWGEKNLIEVHFDDRSKTVIIARVLEGTDHRFPPPKPK